MPRHPRPIRPAQFLAHACPPITRIAILRDARGIFEVVTDSPEIVAVSVCTVEDRDDVRADDGALHSLAALDAAPATFAASRDADFFGAIPVAQTTALAQRAEAIRALLTSHAMRVDDLSVETCRESFEDIATDFLADLLHFCDAAGFDFAALEQRARDHCLTEVQEAREAAVVAAR